MTYNIIITDKASGFLRGLPIDHARIIIKKIHSIKEEPFHYLVRLQGQKLWRLHVMKYRAIIDVVVARNTITVVRIGHRKNVYD